MIGEKLGKYIILEAVGSGSMGIVYRAEDPASGSPVAIKVIRSQVLYDRERRERFLRELLPVAEIRCKGICPILEIGDEEDDFFVVMPFLSGKTLEQHRERKALPWPQALDITIAVAEALASAHAAGAVHRGLKPANIWIQQDGSALVSDCSLARFTEIPKRTSARGTGPKVNFAETLIPLTALAYMSPEQVRGDEIDLRSDIFSLGVILYEMLTGHHPFESRNSLSRMSAILEGNPAPASSRAHIPGEFDSIFAMALAKDPQDRYNSIDPFLKALRAIRDSHLSQPSPALVLGHSGRSFPYKTLVLLAMLLALTIVCMVALLHK
jgi:serine/threonine protein kinase